MGNSIVLRSIKLCEKLMGSHPHAKSRVQSSCCITRGNVMRARRMESMHRFNIVDLSAKACILLAIFIFPVIDTPEWNSLHAIGLDSFYFSASKLVLYEIS